MISITKSMREKKVMKMVIMKVRRIIKSSSSKNYDITFSRKPVLLESFIYPKYFIISRPIS